MHKNVLLSALFTSYEMFKSGAFSSRTWPSTNVNGGELPLRGFPQYQFPAQSRSAQSAKVRLLTKRANVLELFHWNPAAFLFM
jgi:hypothetical protein